ncbi:MAG TPA: hypothetical protein VGR16_00380, partial [Thermomicrobiales bacterium]|nr:hypothetical protein [Thermomicrobiales bacterium]
EPFDQRGHATASEMAALAQKHLVDTLVLAHLWEEIGFSRYATQATAAFNGRVEVAQPGLTIEW